MPAEGEVDHDTRRWDKRLHSERVYEVIDFEVIYDLRLYFTDVRHGNVYVRHGNKSVRHGNANRLLSQVLDMRHTSHACCPSAQSMRLSHFSLI